MEDILLFGKGARNKNFDDFVILLNTEDPYQIRKILTKYSRLTKATAKTVTATINVT
jgi:hypothetical protein